MKNQLSKFFVGAAMVAGMIFTLSVSAQAQYRGAYRQRAAYTKADIDRIIRRVEDRSDIFVRLFDSSLDRSNLDGTKREDRLNERARDLERELDTLRNQFDRTDRYADTRSQVSRVLNTADGINKVMRKRRMGAETEQQWRLLQTELNALAYAYNLRPLRR